MKLRGKLLVAFMVLACISIVSTVVGLVQIARIQGAARNFALEAVPHLQAIARSQLLVAGARIELEEIVSGSAGLDRAGDFE